MALASATRRLGRADTEGREFVAIVAACMGMAALAIDLVLPAFPELRSSFGLADDATEVSRVITAFFLGLAVGQLVYGPLSDRFGRKPLLYAGLGLYMAAAIASAFADSLAALVACRFVWGIGAASPRSLALAMVRDVYEGERMARVMSHVMATFILVPIFAPSVGAGVLAVGGWQLVMLVPVAVAALVVVVTLRLPETLAPERRRAVSPRALGQAAAAVFRNRQTVAFALAATCLFGILSSFVGSTQLILEEVYDREDLFPVVFGGLGVFLGIGALISGRLVMRLGLGRLLRYGVVYLVATTVAFAVVTAATDGRPPFWLYLVLCALFMPCVPALLPSCNTAAMAPLGHVAGMAAALLGTISTALGALLGGVVDATYDGSVRPFAYGALLFGAGAALFVFLAHWRPQVVDVDDLVEGEAIPALLD